VHIQYSLAVLHATQKKLRVLPLLTERRECIIWGRGLPTERENFGGCPPHSKALRISAKVYAAKGIIQYLITASRQLQLSAMLQVAQYNITLSLMKNPPLRCNKILFTTCYDMASGRKGIHPSGESLRPYNIFGFRCTPRSAVGLSVDSSHDQLVTYDELTF